MAACRSVGSGFRCQGVAARLSWGRVNGGALPTRRWRNLVRLALLGCVALGAARLGTGGEEMDIRKGGSLWGKVEADGTIRIDGSLAGEIEADGTVRVQGSILGAVEEDGTIRRDGTIVGAVEQDGTLRKGGTIIGAIEDDGTIRRDGTLWGSAEGCCPDHAAKRAVAAVLTFFTDEF
jgi:cytoskeletal protein CcmA (bactofilin family)